MQEQTATGFWLSPQQKLAWKLANESLHGDSRAVCRVVIRGPLDSVRLRSCLRDLVSRHESLRTTFRRQTGMKVPFQVVLDSQETPWEEFDLSAKADFGRAAEIEDLLKREQLLIADHENSPAVRAFLVREHESQHSLILGVSSLCADAFSFSVVLRDLCSLYAGRHELQEPLRYVQFAQWQLDMLESEEDDARKDRGTWKKRSEKEASLALPLEKKADAFIPEALRFQVKEKTASAVLGSPEPQALLFAGWQALCHRVSQQTDLMLHVEASGREFEELESAVGCFARVLPVAASVEGHFSFADLMQRTSESLQEAIGIQEFYPAEIVDSATASFSYRDLGEGVKAGGVEFKLERVQVVSERFKLGLVAVRREAELDLEFHYDAARLERSGVERIAGWYQRLLEAALANPAEKISRLPLLSEAERRQLLVEWNQTAAEYPAKCLQELFEAQAQRTPERVAVRCGEQALSYAELNARANQLAHYLRGKGVGPDQLVGLCLERSAETMVAVLAVLKAGGAYVPLNPDNPPARLRQQMEGAVVVLTESKLSSQVPEFAGTKLVLDAEPKAWAQEAVSNPSCTTTPENLVYVLYTSGSTGVPKGVAVRHRNLVNYSDFITKRLEVAKHPGGLQFATVSTLGADLGNTCIYPSLISGGTLHVIGYETATDGVRFADYATQYGIDVLKIVPSHLAALLQSQSEPGQAKKLLPRKYLVFGGETLTPKLVEKIASLPGTCELLNHYGPTETTVGSLTLKLQDHDWKSKPLSSIPIGRPIQNTQVYVLDPNLEPVPVGVTGELYIAGAGVTAGYLNQAEKTAERFLPNPFSSEANSTMYRTGDLARYLEDGSLEFLGRGDDQVKVRGFRIELGEIEAALLRHAGVKQALVLAREDEQGDKRLLGYVVSQGNDVTSEELREYLKQEVPDYMVPQAIAILPKFPLTANGKIDRQALPEPESATAQRAYVAPRNEAEQKIAAIWAEVLRRQTNTISIDDNFFDLGGHSLMATQVVSRIRRALSIELPLRTLFEHATVSALALEAQRIAGTEQNEVLSLVRVSRQAPLPLSFAQQRLWVLDRIEPNNPLYNIPRAFQLKGTLDIPSLTRALNEIVRRHESQRTTFATGKNGEPVQVIADSLVLDVPVIDLTHHRENEREAEAKELAAREAKIPFDLSAGPLLRGKILKLGSNDHVLLLTMHHIVSDAWSASIFFQELGVLYEAFTQGRLSPLPELAVQYADYAAWQRAYLQRNVLDEQLSYWREHLKGAPPLLELPADRPRPEARTFAGAYEAIPLAADIASAAKEFSQKEGATWFMVLLAAFNALLSRYSGQEHIVLGTDIANRTTSETERMIGFFINLLPLHVDLSGTPTFRELVSRVREVALGAYAHQDIPFDKLVEDLRPERSLSHNPIVQALFVMQNIPPQRRELAGVEMRGFPVPLTRSKFDVAIFIRESNATTFQDWLYSTELFERSTIFRMAAGFEAILRDALAHPEKRISELAIQSEEEKQRLEGERSARKQAQRKKLGSVTAKAVHLRDSEPEK